MTIANKTIGFNKNWFQMKMMKTRISFQILCFLSFFIHVSNNTRSSSNLKTGSKLVLQPENKENYTPTKTARKHSTTKLSRLKKKSIPSSTANPSWVVADSVSGTVTTKRNKLSWISPNTSIDDENLMNTYTTCNAYWNDIPINSGEHYWEFLFLSLDSYGAAVGLTNQQRFSGGTVSFGLLYDGYLTTGDGELLDHIALGPSPATDEVVGVLASYSEDSKMLRISFFWNSQPLGVGFDVLSSILPDAFPAVQLSGTGTVEIRKLPPPRRGARSPVKLNPIDVAGEWEIIPSSIKTGDLVTSETLAMQFKDSDFRLQLSLSPAFSLALLSKKEEQRNGKNSTEIYQNTPIAKFMSNDDLKMNGWRMVYITAEWEDRFYMVYETNQQGQWVWKMIEEELHPLELQMDDDLRRFTRTLFEQPDIFEVDKSGRLNIKRGKLETQFIRSDASPSIKNNPFNVESNVEASNDNLL